MIAVDDKGTFGDSPHCKITNDLLSCLFLNYNKRSVMTLVLPVAIKVGLSLYFGDQRRFRHWDAVTRTW